MQIELSGAELVRIVNSLRDRADGLEWLAADCFMPPDLRDDWSRTALELKTLAFRICLDAGLER